MTLLDVNLKQIFTDKYAAGGWGFPNTSGPGSTLEATLSIRQFLPYLLGYLNIQSILDIPCGDFSWFSLIPISSKSMHIKYIGADIVSALVDQVREKYSDITRDFVVLDITCDVLPQVDLVFCRDCMIHLPNASIIQALDNIRMSRSTYLFVSTFTAQTTNPDIEPGAFRPVNLQAEPFNLPQPMLTLQEQASRDAWPDKCLALWLISDLLKVKL